MPRFDQSFSGLCEQNLQDTLQLKQRYLDAKAKRTPKSKQDRKQQESIQSSIHVQQKFMKHTDELEQTAPEHYEPPVKLHCTTQQGSHQNEGLTKFSVEIVQQLEFTTSAANSQPQQISTNVTVKAHTNASVKSNVSSPKSNPSTPAQQKSSFALDVDAMVECVKQEPDNDFADLDQCAAALEKDAANAGASFGGFSDLIGEDTNDEIITSDAFNDLISDISNYPELMKDFDFEDKPIINSKLKMEENVGHDSAKQIPDIGRSIHNPLPSNQSSYMHPVFESHMSKNRVPSYPNVDFNKTELSPAAQTLKQMAEQHQHKNQMGFSFSPNARIPNSRSPFSDFQFPNDYGSPNNISNFQKENPSLHHDMIKQEMLYQNNDFESKRKCGMYKQQQYQAYNSPSGSCHGSPGYIPKSNSNQNTGNSGGNFSGATPPRPTSGSSNNSGTTLQINQAQQLHITHQSHGHAIQVSSGQQLYLNGNLKGNVSISAQQGIHFNQNPTSSTTNTATSQAQNSYDTSCSNPTASSKTRQNSPVRTDSVPQNNNTLVNDPTQSPNPRQHMTSSQAANIEETVENTLQGAENMQQPFSNQKTNSMHGSGQINTDGNHMPGSKNIQTSGNLPLHMNKTYSLSQSQTNNLPQKTTGGMPVSIADVISSSKSLSASGHLGSHNTLTSSVSLLPEAPVSSTATSMPLTTGFHLSHGSSSADNASINAANPVVVTCSSNPPFALSSYQQNTLRAQTSVVQHHAVRPPPPDYKSSANLMQARCYMGPNNMTRKVGLHHQPILPSGPAMRPHDMYNMIQPPRTMYPRQQGGSSALESTLQPGSNEWRHLVMSQQQNVNFNPPIRGCFKEGFTVDRNNLQHLSSPHQQLRSQQIPFRAGGLNNQQNLPQCLGQVFDQGVGHMNTVNQHMVSHMQQQQQTMMHQNTQMPMNIRMQQSQSVAVSNQTTHHSNMLNNSMIPTNIRMQQSQSMTMSNQSMHQSSMVNNSLVNTQPSSHHNSSLSSFTGQPAFLDNLEFFDNLPTTDSSSFTEQELLNSFDSDCGFNLDF